MSGMFRSMVGGKGPQWPAIPWHVTDAAAALPPDHAKYAAGEHTKCAAGPLRAARCGFLTMHCVACLVPGICIGRLSQVASSCGSCQELQAIEWQGC